MEEHKSHSPKCEFLLLNKKEEDWTVEDFLELETKRQINRMQKIIELKVKEYRELAQHVQSEMEKLVWYCDWQYCSVNNPVYMYVKLENGY